MSYQYYDTNTPSQSTSSTPYQHQHQHVQSTSTKRKSRKFGAIQSRDWESDRDTASNNASVRHRDASSAVSAAVASKTMQRFLALRVREEGFERAETAAMVRLELEVVAFIEQMFARAKAFADNSERRHANAEDVLAAAQEYDLDVAELVQEDKESKKRSQKRKQSGEPELSLNLELVSPERRSTSPELLPSDDEDTAPVVPQTLRSLPSHLPPLPPKHTYLRTPVPPPKKQALPSLEKKLENAALVQESLKNLLLATEVDADANDGELFGGVVNWEATRYPRKKWKIGT